jgi:anthranilate/para-aminobenzoate synthase component II
MLSVSGRMSTKTGVEQRSTKAAAVQEKVKEDMMTLSPGPTSASSAASSSAAVLEWTISAQRT